MKSVLKGSGGASHENGEPGAGARGVLIGAYERDNFGDLLFLSLTTKALSGYPHEISAPFAGDTRGVGGSLVVPYQSLLDESTRFMWVVGGEVGSTTFQSAARMSAAESTLDDEAGSESGDGSLGLRCASPYLPRPSRFGRVDAPYVINSVGLSGVQLLPKATYAEARAALMEATHVSVRDQASHQLLRRMGVPHALAPDLVHTIREHPSSPDCSENGVALVQVSAEVLMRGGIEQLASVLAAEHSLKSYELRLFCAGTAPGHDSPELLARLADRIGHLVGPSRISVSKALTAADKAAEIGRSGLWIGTSLHGFVVATAFGVPAVGLVIDKVEQYARSWNIPYPAGVPIRKLGAAVEAATSTSSRSKSPFVSETLSRLANLNLEGCIAAIDSDPMIGCRSNRPQERVGAATPEAIRLLAARGRRWIDRRRRSWNSPW